MPDKKILVLCTGPHQNLLVASAHMISWLGIYNLACKNEQQQIVSSDHLHLKCPCGIAMCQWLWCWNSPDPRPWKWEFSVKQIPFFYKGTHARWGFFDRKLPFPAAFVISGLQKGRRKGATSKNVRNRQKVSKSFSTLSTNFRAGQKTSKIVKKRQKVFRHFSTIYARRHFSGPFWGALM